MKYLLIFILVLVGFSAMAQAPIQRQAFTTNILPATIDTSASTIHNTLIDSTVTGNGTGLTNLNAADGMVSDTWGSASGMQSFTQGPTIFSMGGPLNWGLGGDLGVIFVSKSTNFTANGGFGCSVTGVGASGATVLGRTQGPTFGFISTNESDSFINGGGSIVFNYDAVNDRTFSICSPGGGTIGSDTMNYAGLIWDPGNHALRVPLIPTGFTNGGCNQPSSIVSDFTCTPPAVAPAFASDGYIDSNGKVFTAYSNNADKTHIFFTSSSAGNPVANGTLTRISSPGTGDATITYSAVVANRTYIGDTFNADQQSGRVTIWSNVVSTKGAFISQEPIQLFGASAANPFGTTATNGNPAIILGNSGGLAVASSRGQEITYLGSQGHAIANLTWVGWNNANSFDIGGDDLGDANTIGNGLLYVHGSIAAVVTNSAVNYSVGPLDSTIILNGFGTISATLPDATFHAKGRIYIIKNAGTTNSTILTTSGQLIDGKASFTNAPQQTAVLQSDNVGWKIISNYGGAPTNFYAIASAGWTNTDNWTHELHLKGTAITYTNFDGAGQAYETNTTLVNTDQTILLQPGGKCVAAAAAGLSGTVHAIIR